MSSNEWLNMLMTFVIACVATAILTPFSIRLAYKIGAMDVPKDKRRIHSKPMPRIGGVAFITGFFISTIIMFVFCNIDRSVNFQEINLWGFYLGAIIIAIVGFLDDINVSEEGLKPATKLFGQIIAALCIVLSGARILYINIPFLEFYGLNDVLSIIITVGWVVGVTNAINLLDGLDGLASGVSAIAVLSLLVIFVLNGSAQIALILIAALLGGLIGFLPYNFNPAKTFMGDVGSNFLGYTLAAVSMLGMAKTYTFMAIIIPVLVLALPIFDTLFAIIRRVISGKPIMQADRGHLHHRLIDLGLSQKQAVLVLYAIAAMFGIFAIVLMESSVWKAIGFVVIMIILILLERRNLQIRSRKGLPKEKIKNLSDGGKLRVMLVFGTRPEAIKMCPLVLELKKREDIVTIVCVTAQHREMLDQVLDAFDVKPDYDLNIMKDKQTLTHITSSVLNGVYEVIQEERPDIVLVHGDTTTTMAAAQAAFDAKVKVGHVEAGLRTYDKYSPFPEEMNRKIVTQIADLFFAPTQNNKNNLLKEAINEDEIYITGNTVIDALKTTVKDEYTFTHPVLSQIDFSKKVIFMTAHRRENLGKPLHDICEAVKEIATTIEDVEVIYPVHLNPVVQETAHEVLDGLPNVHLIEPLDVVVTHNLINRSTLVLTDSGGIQEEAPSLGKPVLVLRNETERPEAVTAGTVKVVGTDKDTIVKETTKLLTDDYAYEKMSKAANPYGDGNACDRIVEAIRYYFGLTKKRVKDLK
ncbi:MAG: UDP-N-acetylglucosamine 2-epimerase (non-hydrolyzing) [Clostridia bacterium]|nr:UDP-N-acetylglucosamine 2-epimerase (non-hydrolyzing) [Clostridia bacterium]